MEQLFFPYSLSNASDTASPSFKPDSLLIKLSMSSRLVWSLLSDAAVRSFSSVSESVPEWNTQRTSISFTVKFMIPSSQTGELAKTLEGHGDSVLSAAYSPNGIRIITASNNGTARIWDSQTGELIRMLEEHNDFIISVAYSPDGKRIVTASWDSTTRICLTLLKENEEINSLSTSAVELGFYGDGDKNFIKEFRQYFLTGSMVYRYFSARHRLSDSGIKDLTGFLNGLQLQANKNASEDTKYEQILKNFEDSVKKVLTADGEVSFRFEDTEVYLCESGKKHPLDRLPHGFQALLGIIGTLYAAIHKQGGSPDTAKGLVLIDEPETHLHVALQKRVLPLLTEVFKNIQFVVATHSPYVLNSVKDMVVYDMETQGLVTEDAIISAEECHLTA